jgi:hypothetical protein
MNVRQLLAVAAAATLLVPGTALAGKGNGKPTGKPEGAAQGATDTVKIRTLEGPEDSPESVETPTTGTPEGGDAVAPAKARSRARKSAKAACKGLSKKHRKGTKGTPYSRCIVAANKRPEQPVAPTEPVVTTDPVEAPIA